MISSGFIFCVSSSIFVFVGVGAFLEENEISPGERICDPVDERKAQSCKNSVTILEATFDSIQGQHEGLQAAGHIGIYHNCRSAVSCLKTTIGCAQITEEIINRLEEQCNYMIYLTGAFYPCSLRLQKIRNDIDCVASFFEDDVELDSKCEKLRSNRSCLKWAIRQECGTSYWNQYKPYWESRYKLLKCE